MPGLSISSLLQPLVWKKVTLSLWFLDLVHQSFVINTTLRPRPTGLTLGFGLKGPALASSGCDPPHENL